MRENVNAVGALARAKFRIVGAPRRQLSWWDYWTLASISEYGSRNTCARQGGQRRKLLRCRAAVLARADLAQITTDARELVRSHGRALPWLRHSVASPLFLHSCAPPQCYCKQHGAWHKDMSLVNMLRCCQHTQVHTRVSCCVGTAYQMQGSCCAHMAVAQ